MRISGFASGMDIDTMVRDLMKAESMPLQKMQQDKQVLEWKRDDYRTMNKLLLDFRSTLTNMKLTSNYRAREVSSTDEAKVTATASSAASESSFNISNVTQLATAATLKNEGGLSTDANNKIDPSKGLYGQDAKFLGDSTNVWKQGAVETKSLKAASNDEVLQLGSAVHDMDAINIKLNGKSYEAVSGVAVADLEANQVLVDEATGSLSFKDGVLKSGATVSAEFIAENKTQTQTLTADASAFQLQRGSINDLSLDVTEGGTTTTYTIGAATGADNEFELTDGTNTIGTINRETGKILFNTPVTEGSEISATYDQNYTNFNIGSHTSNGEVSSNFIVAGNESLNSVINEVNKSNAGVSMFYDSFSDQVTLTRKETGNYNGLDSKDPANGGEVANREITTSGAFINNVLRFGNGTESGGDNIKLNINGLDTERNSNNFQVDGVTFNVKQTFAESTTLNVSNDSEAVFDNIKEFVETYNTLIGAVNGKVNQEFYRDYRPLTDDQRESLSEKQQEDWEERAKSGLLRRDTILSGALSDMRNDFYSPINNAASEGGFNQLASIGITTTSNYMEGGKLEINEAKLKEAISSDPDAVENLFRGTGDTYGEKGIAHRLTDTVNASMDRIYERAGRATATNQQYTLGRNLTDISEQIDRFEYRLNQIEDRYWRQFTAMEKAMMQANNQATAMMQQFGGMGQQ
ncbi:flagellar filament capping protein FliD [Saliterribacillus persicus]|uniref:Flagellar hook-associated protein 2 n=1 Tax=Saliterribacillus persicus TaxID=930114 RepID=A0A368Y5V1_9BACI|nr:flagellar filament capping protein FliD [Saliterribacillus persicus]RCW74706.1 flagellar hook-associated protein 2 [Saliterribacillus persicus]